MDKSTDFSQLMFIAAAILDEGELINKLKEDIESYDLATGKAKEEAFEKVQFTCTIIMTKRIVPDMDAAMKVGKEMEEHKKIMNLFKTDDQQN